jgi:hypothetical protein
LGAKINNSECFCLCLESRARLVGSVKVLPWREGLVELGL